MAAVMKALGTAAPVESKDVTLSGPEIAENGSVVPLAVATTLPGVKRLLVLIEKNPATLAAIFEVSDAIEPAFQTRVKMGQSSNVYAVAVMADGRCCSRRRTSRSRWAAAAAEPVCKPSDATRSLKEIPMSDPMSIRARATGDKVAVRVLMQHEMETGQRKDAEGKTIPACSSRRSPRAGTASRC